MPLLNTKKKRRIKQTIKLSESRPLYRAGQSSAISLPKHYIKALGWIPGRSKIEILLNVSNSTLVLSLVPGKKFNPPAGTLPKENSL